MKEIGSNYWLAPNVVEDLPKNSDKSPTIFDGASYVSTCRTPLELPWTHCPT